MSVLLKEIRRMNPGAASVLERAQFYTDAEIQTLTREDLNELFSGPEKLRLRRNIFDTIHKQKPVQMLLKDLQAFIPQEALRDALTSHGVLVDYLHMLKDMRTQLDNVQSFLNAHVEFLENLSQDGSQQQQGQGSIGRGHSVVQTPNISGAPSTGSATDGREPPDRMNDSYNQNEASSENPQTSTSFGVLRSYMSRWYNPTENTTAKEKAKESTNRPDLFHADKKQHNMHSVTTPLRCQVNYKMVVSGKTFDAHRQILDRIQASTQQLNLVNMDNNVASGDCQVTFVFCPVVSRVGTDVEAAMKEVQGSGPVIMVLMNHSHEAKHVPSYKTQETGSDKVIHYQNVFYHEKSNGLINCKENDDAIAAIRNNLLNYFAK